MPVNRSTHQPVAPLSAIWRYYLLLGRYPEPGPRILGWVEFFQALNPRVDHAPIIAAQWARHRVTLLPEATRAGFRPWAETGVQPSGRAVTAWAGQFLAANTY